MNLQFLYNQAKKQGYLNAEKMGAELSKQFILHYVNQLNINEIIQNNPTNFILSLLKLATNVSLDDKFKILGISEIDDAKLKVAKDNYLNCIKNHNLPKSYQNSSSMVAMGGFYRSLGAIMEEKISNNKTAYVNFAKNLKDLVLDIKDIDDPKTARDKLRDAKLDFKLKGLTTNIVATILYPICPKAFPLTNGHVSLAFKAFDELNDKKSEYNSLEKLRANNNDVEKYIGLAEGLENVFYQHILQKDENDREVKIERSFGVIDKIFHLYNMNSLVSFDSPNVILYGSPGTGKTYTVKTTIDAICQGDKKLYEFVQFHPSYTYEDFIEGIKPKGVTKNGNIRFELVNGIFKNFCIKAKNDPSNNYYFIVDEINRANLSAVFGETLSLLESDYRHKVYTTNTENNETKQGISDNLIKTQYSALLDSLVAEDENYESLAYEIVKDDNGKKSARFGIPSNLYFIGMMNDVDKSIDAFDLALRRRFTWIRKDCDYDVIESQSQLTNGEEFINIADYINCAKALNKYIKETLGLGSSYEFGHAFFMKISTIATKNEIQLKNLEELFDRHLRPTLREYLRAFFSEKDIEDKLKEALVIFTKPLSNKANDAEKLPTEA